MNHRGPEIDRDRLLPTQLGGGGGPPIDLITPTAAGSDQVEIDPRILGAAAFRVGLILFVSSAFFWQARDWNTASRLMLTYSLVDRGEVAITGLHRQTRDAAFLRGNYYSDKPPGFALLAVPIYGFMKTFLRQEPHPRNVLGMRHWPADYWVTLFTSGLATALTGAMLVYAAAGLGCGPRRAALVGLAYGLCTPAYVYATLAYGHQVSAAMLLAAFLLVTTGTEWPRRRAFLAGLLGSYAVTVELSVAVVATVVAVLIVVRCLQRDWPWGTLLGFAMGCVGPGLILAAYNVHAFGSPVDFGYAHHVLPRFREVHRPGNPLGLGAPRWDRTWSLLWGQYRGLLTYAPILLLAPIGWFVLASRQIWLVGFGSLAACAALFLVNLSYPEWTGGWSTGPRLLVPILPLGMLGVAGALVWTRPVPLQLFTGLAVALTLVGGAINLGCAGVGGRLPESYREPLTEVVWPLWRGDPVPREWIGGRFALNLITVFWPNVGDPRIVAPWLLWMQFLPLLALQILGVGVLLWRLPRAPE